MSGIPPAIPRGIGPLVQSAGRSLATDQSGASWENGLWWQQLQPGSWRGVGFVMDAAETRAGRRVAEHEYPYRDSIWVEDLGKLPRRFAFQAYLTGDDVYQQRDAMIAACEQPGVGTLVHPTMGEIQCVLIEFSTADRRERGRYVEITFSFVVSSSILFPQTAIATGDATNTAAAALDDAALNDFIEGMVGVDTVPPVDFETYTDQARAAVDDPGRALAAVTGLPGFYGRYASGNRTELQPSTATVESALETSVASRETVLGAIDDLNAAAAAF